MRCPRCGSLESRVVDSRLTPREDAIRRRRECEGCAHRFTSYERVEVTPALVVKKNGERERFDREKLRAGLGVALHRRPVSGEAIEELLRGIELRLHERPGAEVSSRELGDWVMEFLRQADTIAFVRFASVYRAFKDIGELLDEVASLAREARDVGEAAGRPAAEAAAPEVVEAAAREVAEAADAADPADPADPADAAGAAGAAEPAS